RVEAEMRRMSAVGGALALLARASSAQTGSIAGVVTEKTSRHPVAAATVTVKGGPERTTVRARSGEDGRYLIADLTAGTYTIEVRHFAFAASTGETVTVTAGATVITDLQMRRARDDDPPVVSAASRTLEARASAPAATTIVSANDIARRPATTLADLLDGVAGVDVNRNGVLSTNIALRGFNNAFSGAPLMLTDGRVAALPSLLGNVPYLFPPIKEDIERIEVVPGAHSALYGPNAGAGVLQIITKSPFTSRGTMLSVDGGSQSMLRTSLRHAGVVSPRVGYKVSAQYLRAKDWPFTDPQEGPTFPSGRQGDTVRRDFSIRQSSGEARLDIRPTSTSELITTVGAARVGNALEYVPDLGTVQVRNWTLKTFQQRARVGRFFAQAYVNVTDAGNAGRADSAGSFELRTGLPVVNHSRQFSAQLQHALAIGARHQVTYGTDFTRTDPSTDGTVHGGNEKHDVSNGVGAYGQARTKLGERLDLITALRADIDSRVRGSRFSPRVALVFRPTPSHSVRAAFNRAFALPSDLTLYEDYHLSEIPGTDFRLRTVGNPPKGGFRFKRLPSCATSFIPNLCMLEPPTKPNDPNNWVPIDVKEGYHLALDGAEAAIATSLSREFKQGGRSEAAANALAAAVVAKLRSLTPTAGQVLPELRYMGARLVLGRTDVAIPDPADGVQDIDPLTGMQSTSWEAGYSGILWNRLRLSLDAWSERRRGFTTGLGASTPAVFMDKASLQQFLTKPIYDVLIAGGFPESFAEHAASALASGQSEQLAKTPVGIVQFATPGYDDPFTINRTFRSVHQAVDVNGFDLALEYILKNPVSISGTYSWMSRLAFPEGRSTEEDIVSLNAPNHKASLSVQYQRSSWGLEIGGHYQNGYPVHSGVYATDLRKSGRVLERVYDPIFAAGTLKFSAFRRFELGHSAFIWSVRGDNLSNHPYRSLPGTPLVGRSLVTQLLYSF
ncbi:MAG: TonB-dependent receptor, partial [Gemmatimonadaceae bacterium]